MGNTTAWDARFEVTADGKGLVKDAGLVLLRKTADVVGLTEQIAVAFGPGRVERICRGTVLASAAAAIAVGARNLSQIERLLAGHDGTLGACGSDTTLWRTLASVDDRRLARLRTALRRTRKKAWQLIAGRPVGFPWLTIGGKTLPGWIVVDLDATLVECHSVKEQAAGTYKGGWGHHPLGGWVANTGETLTILPRPGNAGSNTAADHRIVLGEVFDQIPDPGVHSKILIRIDGAGASHETIERILTANHSRRRVAFTIGWTITPVEEAAIAALPEQSWTAYLRQNGEPATVAGLDGEEMDYGHVAEITGLPGREGWPGDLRLIVR
ncbi:transposase, partial [Myceligenerans indicum]